MGCCWSWLTRWRYASIADPHDDDDAFSTVRDSPELMMTEVQAYAPQQQMPASARGPTLSNGSFKGTFFGLYDPKDIIGVGSTSTCHRCEERSTGRDYAVKVIDKRTIAVKFSGLLDQFYVEIQVLKLLNHPNIIHLQDVFETEERIYMVMELMQGGELFDYVVEKGTLLEDEASSFVRKITSAIAHMHALDILHRDLKPENLLLTHRGESPEIKIIDFGLAKVMQGSQPRSFLGTRGYLAPEMLQRHSYDKAIDIWALGVIVFVLLCGCLPFDDDSSRIPSEHAAREKFVLRFPRWAQGMSTAAKDLLMHLLDVNPRTRFTAEQAAAHPWVTGKEVKTGSVLQSPKHMRDLPRIPGAPKTPEAVRALAHRMRQQQQQQGPNGGGTYGSNLVAIQEEYNARATARAGAGMGARLGGYAPPAAPGEERRIVRQMSL